MNNSTSSEYPFEEWATVLLINRIVYRGYFLFLILAGTCGNLLTAITLYRSKLRKYTTCKFMAVCALLNIGVLLTNTLNMMLTQGYDIHLRSQFNFAWCRLNAFIAQWIRGMASWTLVIVAFERFQQSKTVRHTPVNKKHIVLLTMVATGFILLIFNLPYLLFTGSKVVLAENTTFLACMFDKRSQNKFQRLFASTSKWQELVTYIIVPCILALILNIFIIKNSFLSPISNEHLKSRSRSRTRRVTTMLLASNIGFLALVAPAQIFYAISSDPQLEIESHDEYKSFIVQGNIYQCLINTYYAASFVFCFVSSSIFRHEISKLLYRKYKTKRFIVNETKEAYASYEKRPFLQQPRLSGYAYSSCSANNGHMIERKSENRTTNSTMETDGSIQQ
ncbi:unnamed protein product [Rotaria magnacalcarata]|uniref:G-protein coupled receptors family 1 profile domain-containing protein n=1 Tax=Rotaria magnacalcarata TaxID=392030 RepID=A0A816P0T7_9BILA|nr:unnamed protein product [Rotaria magnacalcarata]CAF1661400.1 unnamed protein product [Rotaria magnacalcarata]CAF2042102.1 unnamed protein product [Rotaria magnacalcarata]CAF2106521.1 unnamed protein product [Rotaria magnacalcarata]CAF2119741.1 unnamed protein product [Rotaria magnacalcarata]